MDSDTINSISSAIKSLDDTYATARQILGVDAVAVQDLQTARDKLKSALRMALVSKNIIPHVKICTIILQAGMWPLMFRKHPSEVAQITAMSAACTWVAAIITDIVLLKQVNNKMIQAIEIATRCNKYAEELLKTRKNKQK